MRISICIDILYADPYFLSLCGYLFAKIYFVSRSISFIHMQVATKNNFDAFVQHLEQHFGNTNNHHMAVNCLQALRQGSCPALMYAAEFQHIAVDLLSNNTALIAQILRWIM